VLHAHLNLRLGAACEKRKMQRSAMAAAAKKKSW
jgi:hypothetical protein